MSVCAEYEHGTTGVLDWSSIDEEALKAIEEEEDKVKTRIIFAREELKVPNVTSRQDLRSHDLT